MPLSLFRAPDEDGVSTPEIIAWFAVYVLLGAASLKVLQGAVSTVIPVWLPCGIGFALQVRAAPRQRIPLAIVQAVLEFGVEQGFGVYPSVQLHIVYAMAVGAEAWLAGELTRRLRPGRPNALRDTYELRAFLGAAVGASLVGALLASVAEVRYFDEPFIVSFLSWVQSDLSGFIVLAPLALAADAQEDARRRGRTREAIVVLAVLIAVVSLLYGRHVSSSSALVALPFLLFPPLIWAALSFGVAGAAAGSLLLCIVVGSLTELGFGPMAALGFDQFTRQLVTQGFVALLSASALTIGVLMRQQWSTNDRLVIARDASQQAAARFRAYFEGTPEMLAVVDGDGRVVLANPKWMSEFAAVYGNESVIGRTVEDLGDRGDDAALETVHWWRGALAGETILMPWQANRADGSVGVFEMTLAPLHDDGARIVGAYMAVRDVAELRARQHAEARARRLETVGRLAGGVAHDFNNIVTGIQGYAQLLADSLPHDHQALADLEEIRKAGTRAAGLTQQLLAYARRQVIEPRQVQIPELLEGISGLMKRLLGEDVALRIQAAPGLWTVRVDPGQLEQVIMNLAVNARDAMPNGGQLLVSCENVVVGPAYASVRDLAPGEYVMTAVSDTGVGMTADVLERVFEPFFTTKGQGSGTGLGLATVDGIVRQFDGGISATSELGRGSTFRVFLPRDKSPVTTPAHAPITAEPHPRGREHLLLIEDDESLRLLAVRVLERSGFTVSSYGDGASALGMTDAELARASMLVTDVILPGINGREAADRLRERAPHLKVLFISGYTEDAVVQHGVLDGVVNFLAKPFSPDALARKVRAVLDA